MANGSNCSRVVAVCCLVGVEQIKQGPKREDEQRDMAESEKRKLSARKPKGQQRRRRQQQQLQRQQGSGVRFPAKAFVSWKFNSTFLFIHFSATNPTVRSQARRFRRTGPKCLSSWKELLICGLVAHSSLSNQSSLLTLV